MAIVRKHKRRTNKGLTRVKRHNRKVRKKMGFFESPSEREKIKKIRTKQLSEDQIWLSDSEPGAIYSIGYDQALNDLKLLKQDFRKHEPDTINRRYPPKK